MSEMNFTFPSLVEGESWVEGEMVSSPKLSRAYNAVTKPSVTGHIILNFWHEFLSYWMVSSAVSLFVRYDHGITRLPAPDLSLGIWMNYRGPGDWPTEIGPMLFVACPRENETRGQVQYRLAEWAKEYLLRTDEKLRKTSANSNGGKAALPDKTHIWVAVTWKERIRFFKYTSEASNKADPTCRSLSVTPFAGSVQSDSWDYYLDPKIKEHSVKLRAVMCQVLWDRPPYYGFGRLAPGE
ncbi:hypothetical protein N7456_007700 [Penicillium angulare]|uniref:Uncharacterized protein n=1 Tax=Penicillium angulare TaxID=116970 RepID=A0A9W9FBH5_9EURO|nr:hypothetical protein N7456_007700 [Penicillium angulare]